MLGNYFSFLPEIDLLSFILGLALGGALWAFLSRIFKSSRKVKVVKTVKKDKFRPKTAAQLAERLNTNTLRFSQANHLAGFLVPLTEIFVDTKLIYPYPYVDPKTDIADAYESSQAFPFLPQHPEYYENIPMPSIGLISALLKHNLVSIQGEIGSGKTTLFSAVVSDIIERKGDGAQLNGFLPLSIHCSEIDLQKIDEENPLFNLVKLGQLSDLHQPDTALKNFLSTYLDAGKLIVFLDGLDELDSHFFNQYVFWINTLVKQYPQLRLAINVDRIYAKDLEVLGFIKYFISPLNSSIQQVLHENWRNAIIKSNIRNSLFLNNIDDIDLLWENQKRVSSNFFFATLSLLNDFSLSGKASSKKLLLQSHLSRVCFSSEEITRLRKAAEELYIRQDHLLERGTLNSIFGNKLTLDSGTNLGISIPEKTQGDETLLDRLIRSHILVERQINRFGFCSLHFFGYLLSESYSRKTDSDWKYYQCNPLEEIALRYNTQTDYMDTWIQDTDFPLGRNISLLSRHFHKLTADNTQLNKIAPTVLSGLTNNSSSLSNRLQYLSLLLPLETQFVNKIFEFLISSKATLNKQLAIIGLGFQRSAEGIALVKSTLTGLTSLEKILCTITFFRLWDSTSRKYVNEFLSGGDDYLRRIVCELYALKYPSGKALLIDNSINGSIAIRKASIFGLKLIDSPDIEEHITRRIAEEKEWIVRDAAVRALEEINTGKLLLHHDTPPLPDKSDWLVEFASKSGMGISPNSYPFDVLFEVMKSGTDLEKMAALKMLGTNASLKAVEFLSTLSSNHDYLGDRAHFYLAEIIQNETSV